MKKVCVFLTSGNWTNIIKHFVWSKIGIFECYLHSIPLEITAKTHKENIISVSFGQIFINNLHVDPFSLLHSYVQFIYNLLWHGSA